jgi:hypothetical protein
MKTNLVWITCLFISDLNSLLFQHKHWSLRRYYIRIAHFLSNIASTLLAFVITRNTQYRHYSTTVILTSMSPPMRLCPLHHCNLYLVKVYYILTSLVGNIKYLLFSIPFLLAWSSGVIRWSNSIYLFIIPFVFLFVMR